MRTRSPSVRFALDLFQDAFALEHDRENVTRIRVLGLLFRQQSSQKIFGIFLWQSVPVASPAAARNGVRQKENGRMFSLRCRPCFFAQIFAAESFALREKAVCKNSRPAANGRWVTAHASARCLIGHSFASGFMSNTAARDEIEVAALRDCVARKYRRYRPMTAKTMFGVQAASHGRNTGTFAQGEK